MQTLSITIGRNLKEGKKLSPIHWRIFQQSVQKIAEEEDFFITVANTGKGVWQGEEEENFHLQGIREEPLIFFEKFKITEKLKTLAVTFEQDAISLSIGEGDLI